MEKETKDYILTLPVELHLKLKMKAVEESRTMAEIIIEALKEKLR